MYAMMNLYRVQHTNSVDPKQILKVQVKFKKPRLSCPPGKENTIATDRIGAYLRR